MMKTLSKLTLLAVMLLGGANSAWADGEVAFEAGNTIGAEDNSSAWYDQKSKIIAIGPHETLKLKFKTFTATDAELTAAGVTEAWRDQLTHAINIWDAYDQNFYMKGNSWGWKAHSGTTNDPEDYDVNNAIYTGKSYGWGNEYRTMIGDGADVVMTVARFDSELRISQEFTTSGGSKYYHYFVGTFGKADEDLWLQMTTERAHVTITENYSLTDSDEKLTGTLIGVLNNTGDFKVGNNEEFTIKPESSLSLHFNSYTNKINPYNGWGIEMQCGSSYFDLTPGNKNIWGALNVNGTTNWGTWPEEEFTRKDYMDGADVVLTITRSGANVQVTAIHTPKGGSAITMTHSFTPDLDGFATQDVAFRFAVEGGHLDLLPVTATISQYGWATFSSDYALDFSKATEGLTAYMVTGHEGTAVTKTEVTGTVPAGTGLLLKGNQGSYNIPIVGSSDTDVSANLMKPGTGDAVSAESGYTRYVLSVNSTTQAAEFQKIVSTAATVGKGKAYLEFTGDVASPVLDFDFSSTTGIDTVEAATNAQQGDVFYNLSGQRVAQPKKGLYIVNGKKIIR